MRVKFVVSVAGTGFAYSAGEERDCSEAEARAWIDAGHAVPVRASELERTTQPAADVERATPRPSARARRR